jgi:hypothetical protein
VSAAQPAAEPKIQRYIARFQPEAELNGYVIKVDPPGPSTWDATAYIRKYAAKTDPRTRNDLRCALAGGYVDMDFVRDDPAAPAWVQEWSGPFEVDVSIERVPVSEVKRAKAAATDERRLTADQLRERYDNWGEHPEHSLEAWQHQVANDETRRGYWEWVAAEIEANDSEATEGGT